MKILTDEIALREETRTLQQARPQLKKKKLQDSTRGLASSQGDLVERTEEVIDKVYALPEGEQKFPKEIAQLTNAARAMVDAEKFLGSGDTGPNAMAAETEAIEWLLLAKRAGSGGGGGGSDAGAGSRSGGNLQGSALARLGGSAEKQAKIVKRNTNQATGKAGRKLPEEFRAGLDQFFDKLESNE
jgi:hypothetical protein